MDDALHLAPTPSERTSTSAHDGWQVSALLIVTMVGLVIATACPPNNIGRASCS